MQKNVPISDDDKWQAVVSCDRSYDGLFFYGVKTTGIFCRPQCKAKVPARENVVFFGDPADAMAAGFRPCKKCRPDQVVFEPDLELVKRAAQLFHKNYDKPIDSSHITKQLGVSTSHMIRLFKQYNGLTPLQYINRLRVAKAMELLEHRDMDILDAAYTAGFKSLSVFYKCFKAQTGYTPNEYRKSRKTKILLQNDYI